MSGDGTADPSVMADLCRSYGLDGPAVALDRLRDEVDDLRTAADIASINAKADDALIRRLRGLLARGLDAIEAIPRPVRPGLSVTSSHHICDCHRGHCFDCASPWPCPTEQAHIAAEEIRKALGEGT